MHRLLYLWVALLWLAPAFHLHANTPTSTLIVQDLEGQYQPGLATAWQAIPGGIVFVLPNDVDARAIAAQLKEALDANVSWVHQQITIAGMREDELFASLVKLHLQPLAHPPEFDPLAALASMGTNSNEKPPEGGGSIRATDPKAPWHQIAEAMPDRKHIAKAVVLERLDAPFPAVLLKIRIRKSPRHGVLSGRRLGRGEVLQARVRFWEYRGDVDWQDVRNQRNVGARFLKKGDRIEVVLADGPHEGAEIIWLERIK